MQEVYPYALTVPGGSVHLNSHPRREYGITIFLIVTMLMVAVSGGVCCGMATALAGHAGIYAIAGGLAFAFAVMVIGSVIVAILSLVSLTRL